MYFLGNLQKDRKRHYVENGQMLDNLKFVKELLLDGIFSSGVGTWPASLWIHMLISTAHCALIGFQDSLKRVRHVKGVASWILEPPAALSQKKTRPLRSLFFNYYYTFRFT